MVVLAELKAQLEKRSGRKISTNHWIDWKRWCGVPLRVQECTPDQADKLTAFAAVKASGGIPSRQTVRSLLGDKLEIDSLLTGHKAFMENDPMRTFTPEESAAVLTKELHRNISRSTFYRHAKKAGFQATKDSRYRVNDLKKIAALLIETRKNLSQKSSERMKQMRGGDHEKIKLLKKLKTQLELRISEAEKKYDYLTASKLKYEELPEIENELKQLTGLQK